MGPGFQAAQNAQRAAAQQSAQNAQRAMQQAMLSEQQRRALDRQRAIQNGNQQAARSASWAAVLWALFLVVFLFWLLRNWK